jgi:hypothetical protein
MFENMTMVYEITGDGEWEVHGDRMSGANIASCHGAHAGGPIETPTLAGQGQEYLLAQLTAFANGDRHNDIYNRMRGRAGSVCLNSRLAAAK